jgi:hypothetical protein
MPPRMLRDLALYAAVFVIVTAVAEALGAANLGTAATFGQMAAALTAVVLILRR